MPGITCSPGKVSGHKLAGPRRGRYRALGSLLKGPLISALLDEMENPLKARTSSHPDSMGGARMAMDLA